MQQVYTAFKQESEAVAPEMANFAGATIHEEFRGGRSAAGSREAAKA